MCIRDSSIKRGTEFIGMRARARVVKNKVAPPFRNAEFDIMFNRGISKSGDILDLSVDKSIVKKAGAFYSYGDMRLGQGREAAKEYLEANVEVMTEIENKIRDIAASSNVGG